MAIGSRPLYIKCNLHYRNTFSPNAIRDHQVYTPYVIKRGRMCLTVCYHYLYGDELVAVTLYGLSRFEIRQYLSSDRKACRLARHQRPRDLLSNLSVVTIVFS